MITALTLAPVVAALLILALPEARARAVALAGALVYISSTGDTLGGGINLFALGLGVATFVLIMLGAIGQRYATIASGALILSLYIMISIGQQSGVAPEESWALLSR